MSNLPYLASPGNISKALAGIQTAATPDRVSQDFVKTVLKIPGSSGDQMTTFLKRLGFSGPDGRPSDRYKKFRNDATSGRAMADAIREAYAELFKRNEYAHRLSDNELKGLVVEVTGMGSESRPVTLTLSTVKNLLSHAEFDTAAGRVEVEEENKARPRKESNSLEKIGDAMPSAHSQSRGQSLGLNIGYTINLNLPATTDVEVFNAIFKSLKENLLSNE